MCCEPDFWQFGLKFIASCRHLWQKEWSQFGIFLGTRCSPSKTFRQTKQLKSIYFNFFSLGVDFRFSRRELRGSNPSVVKRRFSKLLSLRWAWMKPHCLCTLQVAPQRFWVAGCYQELRCHFACASFSVKEKHLSSRFPKNSVVLRHPWGAVC